MKTVKYFIFGLLFLSSISSQAQVSVNVNVGPPVWGPPVTVEEYYYLPDVNSYYDIRTKQFIYVSNGNWVRQNSLPTRYRNYNLSSGNVIVINDYHGRAPYTKYKVHKVKYVKKGQWAKSNDRHDDDNRGRGNSHSKGKGKGKKHKD
jgi:hypothetical protein